MKKLLISTIISTALCLPVSAGELETYATFDKTLPPGNLAINPDGRMFMSVHEFYDPKLRVVEVMRDGSVKPYPTEAWANAPKEDGDGLRGVLGLRADRNGILWMLDGQSENHTGRIVGWDTNAERLHAIHYIGQPAARATSFLNDLAVDLDHRAIYISDTGDGQNSAIIIVDLETGRARRVLEGSKFTKPENKPMIIDGREVMLGGNPARIGINPITVDPTNTWVYFAPMTGSAMYRIKTTDLLDETLTDEELERRVKRYGDKPISDGSTVDTAGNVYITAMTGNAIGVTKPDGSYKVLFQSDEELSWPDGFSMGTDGYVYATINELHRSPVLNEGIDASKGIFKIVRFKSLADAVNGR